jgi:uncharacterized protein (TIGR02266 family)
MAKRNKKGVARKLRRSRPAQAILPPPLDAAGQLAAATQLEATIYEATIYEPAIYEATIHEGPSEPLGDDFPRDTLVDPPKVLVEEEHRALPRVTLKVDVDLSSESCFFTALSGDVSEGGLFVSTYRTVDVGSEVDVEFSLPNGAVQTRGLVRWQRDASPYGPPGVGIEFEVLSDEERQIIHEFCAARAPLYYEVDQL